MPDLHRPGDAPGDRPGSADPAPGEEPGQRRPRRRRPAVDRRVVADEDPRGGLPEPRLGLLGTGPEAAQGGPRLPAAREARPGTSARPLPARARREHLQGQRRGHHLQPRAALSRDGLGLHQGRDREVHGQQAVPDVRRQAAPARDPRGDHRRPDHLGYRDAVDHGRARLGERARSAPQRARARHRLPGRQGDRGPARVPRRRRPRLPDARPDERHAVRWRGAADPARDADRDDADGRPVHPRRTLDRPPPARQRQAHRDADPAARPRQHRPRRRARRGDDPDGRLGRRHRAGCRGARWRDHLERDARGAARRTSLDHRRVSARRSGRGDPPTAAQGVGQGAAGHRRPGAQPPVGRPAGAAGHVRLGHRGQRQWQEHARHRGAVSRPGPRAQRLARAGRCPRPG